MSKLNITEEEVTVLYSEAGREMNYRDQQFKYDKEIPVTQEYKSRINSVLTDTRRCGPLRWPSSSSCGELRPSAKAFH